MGRRASQHIDTPRATLKIEGHRLVTVSLSPDDVQWIKGTLNAAKASGAGAPTRSLVIRAALRQLRCMVKSDPDRFLEYLRGGQAW